jgi:hypothetical protein
MKPLSTSLFRALLPSLGQGGLCGLVPSSSTRIVLVAVIRSRARSRRYRGHGSRCPWTCRPLVRPAAAMRKREPSRKPGQRRGLRDGGCPVRWRVRTASDCRPPGRPLRGWVAGGRFVGRRGWVRDRSGLVTGQLGGWVQFPGSRAGAGSPRGDLTPAPAGYCVLASRALSCGERRDRVSCHRSVVHSMIKRRVSLPRSGLSPFPQRALLPWW